MLCYFSELEGTPIASSEIHSFEYINYADRFRTSAVDILILERLKELELID
ncbi:hypothetical protein ACFQ2C_07970 [Sphingobacterium daejeonense]|uniref:Uncharacterized protein n=1 Tax=Sphingobacterium daejeonense TaxID=371142 RepID=A0ABW3RKF5_9SPHI